MALKCTPWPQIQFSVTEIGWGESGPIDVSEILLAERDTSHWGELGIGQDTILIYKLPLQWNDSKSFLLNFGY